MVPDKFNMVDMGGIDLIMVQGEEVPGLYNRLVESIAQCHYQCLYNWFFDGIVIPPTYVIMEVNEDDEVVINEGVTVTDDDVIHIYSIQFPPEIVPLLAEENGVYNAPAGKDGFNPVTVDVSSHVEQIIITQNGTYIAPVGVDGYSPVVVDISSSNILKGTEIPSASIGDNGDIYLQYTGNDPSYPLPSSATPVSYIKNSADQYIRTGYNGQDNSEYKMIFKYDENQTTQYPSPFGGRRYGNALGDCAYVMYGNSYNQTVDGVSWGANQYIPALSIGSSSIIGKIVTVELSKGNYSITFDGVNHSYAFSPSAIGDGTVDMGIFTGIFGNVYNVAFASTNMRMYGFEIRESGNLVHKYIPCLDPNDVPCVYDYVTGEYLYNAGSGNFTYGTGEPIIMAYCKVNGAWQALIGTNINDVN